jgi:hypothetical protein
MENEINYFEYNNHIFKATIILITLYIYKVCSNNKLTEYIKINTNNGTLLSNNI